MNKAQKNSQGGERKSGILFDLDGVLWDSAPAHTEAFRQAFAEAQLPPLGDYAVIAGMKTEEAVLAHLRRHGLPETPEIIWAVTARKRKLAPALLLDRAKVLPDLGDILSCLRRSYCLAVCSSASPDTIACFMKKSGCARFFEAVVDGTCVKKAKPAPDIYLLGARLLNLIPQEVWILEDSLAGVEAGRAAGMDVIGVGVDTAALRSWGCTAVLPDIQSLPGFVATRCHTSAD